MKNLMNVFDKFETELNGNGGVLGFYKNIPEVYKKYQTELKKVVGNEPVKSNSIFGMFNQFGYKKTYNFVKKNEQKWFEKEFNYKWFLAEVEVMIAEKVKKK